MFIFLWLLTLFFIDFASYYIVRTEEGQPIPKYIYLLYLLYRGLVHRNHRILNLSVLCLTKSCLMFVNVFQISLFQVSMCPFSLFNNFLCLSIFILFVCRCKLSCLFILCCLMSVFFTIRLLYIFHVSIFYGCQCLFKVSQCQSGISQSLFDVGQFVCFIFVKLAENK